jgi:hypothetical protein
VPVAAVAGVAGAESLLGGVLGEVELGAAAGFGTVMAPALAALAMMWPSRTAGPEMDEYHGGRSPDAGDTAPEGFSASPPQPPAPGLVPPGGSVSKPGEEGFSPAPHLPPQPGSVPMPPLPHVLPGPDAEPQGAVIHEQNRNDGLEGNLRSDPRRARDAARQADPAVTQVLKDGEWQAHHLINVGNVRDYKDIFEAAAKAGWRTDEVGNVMPLPATAEDQQKLKGHGIDRPTHRGGHPDWNKEVTKGLENIRDKLSRSSLVEGSDAYNAKARQMLEGLQDGLRIEMLTKPRIGSMPVGTDGLYA